MLYCSNCNTANDENSKLCTACGADLQSAKHRCQMCGTLNARDQLNCTNCGARLVMQTVDESADLSADDAPLDSAPATSDDDDLDMPAWLRELRQSSSPPLPISTEPNTPTPPPSDELPDWLRELRQSPGEPLKSRPVSDPRIPKAPLMPSRFTPAPHDPTPAPPTPSEPFASQPLAAGEVPDWLMQLRAPSAAEPAPSADETPELAPADVPDWLADLRETAPPVGEQPTPVMPTAALDHAASAEPADLQPGEVPDWLKGLAPAQATAQPAEWEISDVAVEELPDWLKPTTPAAKTPAPTAMPATEVPVPADTLVPGDIPSWLQKLRPGELETLSGETIETSGLLAGIRGALPVESVLTLPHKSEIIEPVAATVPVAGFAELFAPQPPPPQVVSNRQVRPMMFRMTWRALLILLIFVVAALPFMPFFSDLRGSNVTRHQPSLDFYQTVEALRPNQLVLVAVDYAGGSRAELDPQARAAILHLLQNKQHIVTLSFVGDGAQLAQDLLSGANPANTSYAYPYNYGDTHINLGYKSDGEAAMRNLVQNPAAVFGSDYRGQSLRLYPIGGDFKSLSDFALLIVFSDDATQVRRWVEQVAQPANKPMLAGVSAAAAPAVRPYYASKQIGGLLEGLMGAAEYEVSLAHPATAAATLDSISYVVLVFVFVVVIGIVLALFFRRRSGSAA